MKKLIFLSVTISLFIFSCTNEKTSNVVEEETVKTTLSDKVYTNSEVRHFLEKFPFIEKEVELTPLKEIVSAPYQLFKLDTTLIMVGASNSEHAASVWNIKDGSYIKSILPIGKGPGEYLPPLFCTMNGRTLSAYEESKKSFYRFTLSPQYDAELTYRSKELLSPPPAYVYEIDSTSFLSIPRTEATRIMIYNNDCDLLYKGADFPDNMEQNDLSAAVKFFVYQGFCDIKPDKTKCAIVSVFTGNFEIYSLTDNKVEEVFAEEVSKSIKLEGYADNEQGQYAAVDRNHPRGFENLYAGEEYLYLLYIGKSDAEKEAKFNPLLLKYDWEGKRIAAYKVDSKIQTFTIDEAENKFYGIDANAENLVTFEL
ncbi:BF3164 family lipoprotein [Chondrinema litorale]|uniref:BF3164 family lipoprotein n=1 Tax=Chondrinema litorale TaxID=2994555 RepID=UPI002543DE8D|nr:BF3164 family lipoprotein [Chondrinema litorale]UZR97338.1 BF3164 family lipoprotein [Chondrinema litorale]